LDDPVLIDLVRQCLATRSPLSTRTGRDGMAPDRLLRCCVMKHLKGWSFRELERELRGNLAYRRFTHFDAEVTPDFTTFSRSFALLSPAVTEQIHQRVVSLACEQGVAHGDKLRTDTTVVESNVHYPTDSSLLGDGIRVLSCSLQRIASECKQGAVEVVHHARAVKHRLLEISRAAKCLTQANQQRMRDSYQKLLALTRGVVRQANDPTLGKETAEGGRQMAAGRNADWPASTLSPSGRKSDPPNQETGVGRRQQRGGQGVESVRNPHRSHSQREST
jgi:IS5 family transposase